MLVNKIGSEKKIFKLVPSIMKTDIWTKEEERILVMLANSKFGKKWRQISEILETKTPTQCKYKFKKLTEDGKIKSEHNHFEFLQIERIKKYFENQSNYTKDHRSNKLLKLKLLQRKPKISCNEHKEIGKEMSFSKSFHTKMSISWDINNSQNKNGMNISNFHPTQEDHSLLSNEKKCKVKFIGVPEAHENSDASMNLLRTGGSREYDLNPKLAIKSTFSYNY